MVCAFVCVRKHCEKSRNSGLEWEAGREGFGERVKEQSHLSQPVYFCKLFPSFTLSTDYFRNKGFLV